VQAVIRLLSKHERTPPPFLSEPETSEPEIIDGEPLAVLSGDVAERYRSMARPLIYTRAGVDLTEAGLTSAGAEEVTF